MFKKVSIQLFSLLLIGLNGNSQTFMHGLGATVNVMTAKINNPSERYTATVSFTNFTYMPRLIFGEKESSSFSLGFPVSAGVGFGSDVFGESHIYYGGELPLVFDFNKGRKSSPDNEDNFGWYIGTGFSYTLTNWTTGGSTDKLNSYGPLLRFGVRFGGGSNHPERATTVGLSFKPGLEEAKFKTFGIVVLMEL
ncbi:MAG TPA: hypothetical protein PKG90_15265 [Chitinophagaceae bacterium]|nr:hypothetical protein [Chitinophagaceae bacterium]